VATRIPGSEYNGINELDVPGAGPKNARAGPGPAALRRVGRIRSPAGREASAVNGGSKLRPGVSLIAFGAMVIGLSAARVATAWDPGPGRALFEVGSCAAGAAVGVWGWVRLRRARAARPDLSWRQFLQADLIGLGIVAGLLAALMAMPADRREGLARSLRELVELTGAARGRL
jgi:hypothetical protein